MPDPKDSDIILRVEHLTKKFPMAKGRTLVACDDVSLLAKKGETVAIVGESGCGKTTLLKTIMNMQPPTSGRILLHETDITKLTGEAKRKNCRHIQMVFQDPTLAFNPKMRVRDIVCEPLLNFGIIKRKELEEKAQQLLAQVDLPADFADRYPHNMSGGQRQRVAIARALALEPEIIACDEATSALDVSVQDTIIRLLVKLQKERGVTYLFICHDLALVSMFSHRIAVMYLGSIVEKLDGNRLEAAHHPYTKALLKAVFSIDQEKNQKISILAGDIPSPLDIPSGCPFRNRCEYSREMCIAKKPTLREIAPNHSIACHYPL